MKAVVPSASRMAGLTKIPMSRGRWTEKTSRPATSRPRSASRLAAWIFPCGSTTQTARAWASGAFRLARNPPVAGAAIWLQLRSKM